MNEELSQEEKPDKQDSIRDDKGRFRPGFSGNLKGRIPGKTMKEFAKDYLSKLNDEEKDDWLGGLQKDIVWKMAEGLPKSDVELSGEVVSKIISVDE